MTAETTKLERREGGEVERVEDRPVYTPATDIFEKDEAVLVRCDMPGVDEKSLEITLEENVLSITGTQAADTREGYDRLLAEYGTGVYHRAFAVSQQIDPSGITARLHNGVLDIEVKKAKEAQPQKIKIEVGK